ncbi:hypothetical protein P3X46_013980 [Hevea brasiliensis]|uniref:Uncharacterized protein n=2 Tax=Hevea brasiliensis TaxID=3981 RepID=A0ABQ9M6Z2_HEVBR|nr:uncharacterized protein LOC110664667 [Hevea brasiliensis]XP_058007555.1 uncharacterized protein LOC110664667 [Hevea brasiliensis]KAF2294938.1 hypothetical protein GH714_028625 [Hevea brasiliensis]KAJ9175423.1 hypothetical protein P3X46_013980 [Hevea brasiliensis]
MECNKDEAAKAKEIAEKKFLAKDLAGAKRFALKAQNLYPGLEGVPQMVATLDVYSSAENKINGEPDWYGILGVDPKADDETVRKQYRKLALMLHPDKNKSIGADGAFKLISEAWSLLSDKSKRVAHDQKRKNAKVSQRVSNPAGGPSTTAGSGGFYNFAKSSVKAHKSTPRTGHSSTPASHKSKPNTFWTVCHRCKMQYEYLRVYLNHNLLCPNCHEPFLAVETAPPPSNGSKTSTTWNFSQQRQSSSHQAASKNTSNSASNNMAPPNAGPGRPDSYSQTNFQWGPFSRAGGASSVAQAASVVQQAYEKVKREREEAQAATKREEALKRKNHVFKRTGGVSSSGYSNSTKRRRSMEDVGPSNYGSNAANQMGAGGASTSDLSYSKKGNFETGRVSGISEPYGTRDVSQFGIQALLMEKARTEIRQKLNEWNSATVTKSSVKNEKSNMKENDGGEKSQEKPEMCEQNKSAQQLDTDDGIRGIKCSSGSSGEEADLDTLETMSIDVPDPDFHNFDKDRTEQCFGENQVWAAYDGDDGMPRYYAMVHKIISLNPFKMRISWLNSKTNSELGPLNWVGSGFSKTCGEFRVGRYEVYSALNSFSHKVKWTKGSRGVICIYPKKGDVWALYRNWSPEWNELTEDEVIHKYDMVEVLEDYSEELGVTVAPLVKVAGFKTVFHQHLDPGEIRCIPKEEMFRFSHHVPSYFLTGQEGPNAPKGCRELDPAATPLELLQVIVDVKEEEILSEDTTKEEKR